MNRKHVVITLNVIVCSLICGVMYSAGVPFVLAILCIIVISANVGTRLAKWEFQNKYKDELALLEEGRTFLANRRWRGL